MDVTEMSPHHHDDIKSPYLVPPPAIDTYHHLLPLPPPYEYPAGIPVSHTPTTSSANIHIQHAHPSTLNQYSVLNTQHASTIDVHSLPIYHVSICILNHSNPSHTTIHKSRKPKPNGIPNVLTSYLPNSFALALALPCRVVLCRLCPAPWPPCRFSSPHLLLQLEGSRFLSHLSHLPPNLGLFFSVE